MVEAKNFIEKSLGVNLNTERNNNGEDNIEKTIEIKESVPVYTPPQQKNDNIVTPVPELQTIQQPIIQIIEKTVYKKQRIHGFFRTLTIIALLLIGFLMLGESTGIITLSINSFRLHQIFPIFIIFSTIIIRSYKGIFGKIFGLILFLTVFGGIFTIGIYTSLNPSSKRKTGNNVNYNIANTNPNIQNNLYMETLVGNSYIEGKNRANIEAIRNSDRNLLISSGNNTNVKYVKLNEDSNRNLLQSYVSNINITIPYASTINYLYIKNLIGLHTIDLTNFQRRILKFHAGINDLTIRVDNVLSGNKIEIQGTAANVDMNIPKDIGVIMYYRNWVGMLKTTDFTRLSGHYYESKNIATAKAILHMYINLGAGNTKINRVD